MRVVCKQGKYRIVEHVDDDYRLEDLKGDAFNAEVNSDISPLTLREAELSFEREVDEVGVYGYELQVWNPEIDCGWEVVDSCWGFVGPYDQNIGAYRHYIIEEMKQQFELKG